MIIVRCMIKQLYQTDANDHQFHRQVETESLTETNSYVGGLKLGEEHQTLVTKVRLWKTRLSTATRHKVVILHQQGLSRPRLQTLLKWHKETDNAEDCRCRNLVQQLKNTSN